MNLPKYLTTLTPIKFWFYLSLTLAIICGILGIIPAFSHQYVVQDDARSHVFWMARFLNPELFPNDIIADYFQSVAPKGYTYFYQLFSLIGIPPLLLNKFLPIILGLITTAYCFGVAIEILPVPLAGFLSTLFLNQNLWLKDDLISATPRAFFYPLFLAFLYYFLRYSWLGIAITISLLGLFYPQGVLLCSALLVLNFLYFRNQQKFTILTIGLTTAFFVLLPYALNTSKYSPIITLTQAKKLPEFFPGGRASFFSDNSFDFWLTGDRSGIIPPEWLSQSFLPPQVWAGLLLFIFLSFRGIPIVMRNIYDPPKSPFVRGTLKVPLFLRGARGGSKLDYDPPKSLLERWTLKTLPLERGAGGGSKTLLLILKNCYKYFPLATKITNKIILLPELALASTGIFLTAHLLLFRLHHPSRYSQHSLRIIMALAGGIAFTLIIDFLRQKFHLLNHSSQTKPVGKIKTISIYIVLTLLFLYPALTNNFPVTNYVVGKAPEIYEFLAQQPSDIRVASLALEANNIPTFAKRSILVGSEYALPYHQGYYVEIKQRANDLIEAQYSPNLEEVKKFIQKYDIDFWLLDSQALTLEYVRKNHRLQQLNNTAAAVVRAQMENGILPSLLNVPESCQVLDIEDLVLLDAKCILK
ncbi:hypothetical protein ACP6PL_16385 [Dapis sp. BLCC M126]|uniref:hypothetical protein n=1 Tax=Dapis sp. BLCC M126 TaxID=3400189 RepID=UPI003CEA5EEB